MKIKKITDNPVTCSFCKERKAYHKIVGYPFGGRTTCKECFDKNNVPDKDIANSEGENQAYGMYKVF